MISAPTPTTVPSIALPTMATSTLPLMSHLSAPAAQMNPRLAQALLELEAAENMLAKARASAQPSPWLLNSLMASAPAARPVSPNTKAAPSPTLSRESSLTSVPQAAKPQQPLGAASVDASSPILSVLVASTGVREYVEEAGEVDILCGRGGKTNHHVGNKRYRQVISQMKSQYRNIGSKSAKTDLSRAIVDHVFRYGGRFLKHDKASGRYEVLTTAEARKKTSQALREAKDVKWTM